MFDEDLAEKLDSLICSFNKGSNDTSSYIVTFLIWLVVGAVLLKTGLYFFKKDSSIAVKKCNKAKNEKRINVPKIVEPKEECSSNKEKQNENNEQTANSSNKRRSITVKASMQTIPLYDEKQEMTDESEQKNEFIATPEKNLDENELVIGLDPNKNVLKSISSDKSDSKVPQSQGNDDESVTWINTCLNEIFCDPNAAKDLVQVWIEAMNDFARNCYLEVCHTFKFHIY